MSQTEDVTEPEEEKGAPPRRRRRRPTGAAKQSTAPAETGREETEEEPAQESEVAPSGEVAPTGADTETLDGGGIEVAVTVPRGWGRKISAKLVRSVVERALETEGWTSPATIEVLILSDDDIREVNATRRGIDEATDVLSFPMVEMKPGARITQDFFVLPPESRPHLGDVLVSVNRVESQAKDAGHSTERELAYLTVHGVLHILGYDHEVERDRRAMRKREEEVLSSLGLRRDSGS